MRKKETGTRIRKELRIGGDRRQGEEEFKYRQFFIFILASCMILEAAAAGIVSGQEKDRTAALIFLGVFYTALFLAALEISRIRQKWLYEKIGNYQRLVLCHAGSCAAAVLFLYLPQFARPVLLLGIGTSLSSSPVFAMTAGMFHCAVYAMCGQENVYALLCSLLLLLCGSLSGLFLSNKEHIRWGLLLLFQMVFGSVMIFSYLSTGLVELDVVMYGLFNGIVSAGAGLFLYRACSFQPEVSKQQVMERILSENFGLVREIQRFSASDYNHARKVSKIAGECAKIIAADAYVAAAGGFYYRLGKMEGEPYVKNGVSLARRNYLPKEIVEILKEYNGEEKLPSTVESALVHIVDSVVTKFDVLDRTTLSSSWNQDILVYQTLNENSAAGLYDRAGFSMNMFLKIRDYLIKEAKLL